MRILIVKISAMGDVLHALPVLDYLHQAAPGSEIDWVVEDAFAGLLRHNPLISKLHTVSFKRWKRTPFSSRTINEVMAVRAGLAERAYDMVIDLQGNIKSGIVAWLTGAPTRIGFSRDFTQESLNVLFSTRRIRPESGDQHITDQYLRLAAAPFGRPFDTFNLQSDIVSLPETVREVADILGQCGNGAPVLLFVIGTTWQTKFWHDAGWAELGRMLRKEYPKITMLFSWGNDTERREAEAICGQIGGNASVLPKLSLDQVAAMVKKVDAVVGGDTGIVHMAAAVGTATVSYYRSSDGERSGPRGSCHRIVQAPMPCTRCFRTRCDKDLECRESITPGIMLAAITDILPRGDNE